MPVLQLAAGSSAEFKCKPSFRLKFSKHSPFNAAFDTLYRYPADKQQACNNPRKFVLNGNWWASRAPGNAGPKQRMGEAAGEFFLSTKWSSRCIWGSRAMRIGEIPPMFPHEAALPAENLGH